MDKVVNCSFTNSVGGTRVINGGIFYQILFYLADFDCIYLDDNEGGHFNCWSCCNGHGDLELRNCTGWFGLETRAY